MKARNWFYGQPGFHAPQHYGQQEASMATQAGKAYMSNREDREFCRVRSIGGSACDEARAILAETEPIIHRPRRHLPDTWHWRIVPGKETARDLMGSALAASLAAILPILDELEAEAGK